MVVTAVWEDKVTSSRNTHLQFFTVSDLSKDNPCSGASGALGSLSRAKSSWVAFQKPYGILPGGISGANGT